jgi:hypothetical protein
MGPGRAAAAVACAVLLAACGETTFDATVGSASPDRTTPATTVPLGADASPEELLPLLVATVSDLDERVVEGDGDDEALARLEAIWALAEPQLRRTEPQLLFGFEQVMVLSRSSVERERPADASKAFMIADDLVDRYLAA